MSAELTPKRMELLKQIAPALKRVAILWNAGDLGMTMRYRASETGAKALGVSVQPLGVREPDDFEQTFAAMIRCCSPTVFRLCNFAMDGSARNVADGYCRPPVGSGRRMN